MMSGMAKRKQKLSDRAWEQIEAVRRGESTRLSLNQEELTEFPPEVLELGTLRHLDLTINEIKVVPYRIRFLSKLESLRLVFNPIESVPDIPGLVLDSNVWYRLRHSLSSKHIRGLHVRPN